jgi:serine/threonine protein kinase
VTSLIPEPLAPGEQLLADYEVIGLLSRGAALDVYEVYSAERDCSVVAKVIRPDRRHVARLRRRLLLEGRLLRTLAHPHLVRGFGVVHGPPGPVVLVETLTGRTVAEYLATERRRPSLESVAYLGLHLCSAMHYLHGRGYLHLDLKPENVIVQEGTSKVIDFSLVRHPGRSRRGFGTPEYLSPEQARGGLLGTASDVWGIGVTLYEAASGHRAFGSAEDADARVAGRDRRQYLQLTQQPTPLRRLRRGLPSAFVALVEACLQPDPARRPILPEVRRELHVLVPAAGVDDLAGNLANAGIEEEVASSE